MSVFGSVFGGGPAGGSPSLPFVAGLWYGEAPTAGFTGAAVVADTLLAMPWEVRRDGRFDQMAVSVSTGSAGLCGLAIYGTDDVLIASTAMTIDTTSIAVIDTALTATAVLHGPGIYWLAYLGNATPSLATYTQASTSMQRVASMLGSPNSSGLFSGSAVNRYSRRSMVRTFASGFPASISTATRSSSSAPVLSIRAA